VPAPVRDVLLAIMARGLHPNGVGYVSYNTYPGCYIRRMVWEILRYHTEEFADPAEKIRQARELMKFLAAGQPTERGAIPALYSHELDGLLNDHDPRVLFHDDLGTVNDPVYFHEFVAHARAFGLRFVAEAEPNAMESRAFPPAVADVLNGLAARDPLHKEQYLDYLRLRRFRQTLLSPDGGAPREDPDPTRIGTLSVSGNPKPEVDAVDLSPGIPITFRAARDALIRTDLAIGKSALLVLAARWPGRIPFEELVRLAAAKLNRDVQMDDSEALGGLLSTAWMAGLVELNGHQPHYVETVSERPIASPIARLQVRSGPFVSTLLHTSMRFDDAPSRLLLQLLDGTRTRAEIASEVAQAFPPDQRPDPAALKAGLDRNLERLAKAALLVG
jgi:methyltransferase-like protein